MAFGIVNSITSSSNASALALSEVSGATVTLGIKSLTLSWSDPADLEYNGQRISAWSGTKVVRKEGSAPTNINDGTLILNSTTRNQYSSMGYTDSNLSNGTTYYYAFFPYTTSGKYSNPVVVSGTPYFREVTVPSISGNNSFTYNTEIHSPVIINPDSTYITYTTASTLSATNAGNYRIEYILEDTSESMWTDQTFETKVIEWSISKAPQTITINKYNVTLDVNNTSDTLAITQNGDGELSTIITGDEICTTTINQNGILTINRISGNPAGSCTIFVNAAENNNYESATSSAITVICNNYKTMTVKIDLSDSNPATCCTYADDATIMTAGSDDWDTWFGEYPVLFKNGAEVVKLNPNNFNQDIDENTVDITNGDNGDVMIAFPRRGLKISTSGLMVTISMTDDPNDSNFQYYAHQRGTTDKNVFYYGAYKGYEASSKLRSLSGKRPTSSKTIGAFRTLAQAMGKADGNGGSGYDLVSFYQVTFIQAMYILKYKNLNSQATIGNGYTYSSSDYSSWHGTNTGGTETLGLTYGTTSNQTTHMKLFGIEDFFGNIWDWVDGVVTDGSRNILTATDNFNDSGSGYKNNGSDSSGNINGWLSKVQGSTDTGFLAKEVSGSETTYFCDYSHHYVGCVTFFGGGWIHGSSAGVFCFYLSRAASYSSVDIGSRLMYL